MLKLRDRKLLLYLLFIFAAFSVVGWCTEVIFRSFCRHHLVLPGFLTGPYCPIYGFGMMAAILFCNHKSRWVSFLEILVLCSVLEYAVSFFFERVFHRLLWDYSRMPFSIGSRVCLLFSIIWGFCGVLILKEAEPYIHRFYMKHRRTADALAETVLVMIVLDTMINVVERI